MILEKIGYSYRDLTIVPATLSTIDSRSQCNPYIENTNKLPIFTAPMASVVNEHNYEIFEIYGITPIIPRNVDYGKRIELLNKEKWVAMSLSEFQNYFVNNSLEAHKTYKVCIDVANGHMMKLYDLCKLAKSRAELDNYEVVIMTGNIANPQTLDYIVERNCVDYIRVGIGGGCGCTTATHPGVHYPQASLVRECYMVKNADRPKIIADGGIKNYDDAIKALALGADYVMIGSLFAQCIESAGKKVSKRTGKELDTSKYRCFCRNNDGDWFAYYAPNYIEKVLEQYKDFPIDYKQRKQEMSYKKYLGELEVEFFGMASLTGQKSMGKIEQLKTPEGLFKSLPVKFTLLEWTTAFTDYLKSAMSYTNHSALKYFIGNVKLIVNSPSEINAINRV